MSRRLQILIDEERFRRLEAHASSRGASVAELVREAIDQAFPDETADRRRAAEMLLAAPQMPVEDWPEMKRELLEDVDRQVCD